MLKIGKFQVNNNVDPKLFLFAIVIAFSMFLLFGISTINNFVKTKDYVKVYASIIEVGYDSVPDGSGDSSFVNYIKVSYSYNNTNYTNKQKVTFRFNKKVGNKVKIYINPTNPSEVRNNYMTKLNVMATLISTLFIAFCVPAYITRKKSLDKE